MTEADIEKKFKRCKEPEATRVCDRCGKEIPPGRWFYVRRKSVILREMAELIRKMSSKWTSDVFLCEDCFKKKQKEVKKDEAKNI